MKTIATPAAATNDLRHSITKFSQGGKLRTKIKIRLNDECRNGHEDFSVTADIDEKVSQDRWRESGGGCCHEHILKLAPELAPFVALHLCTFNGVPMHGVSNSFYWYAGTRTDGAGQKYHGGSGVSGKPLEECKRIFLDTIRGNAEDFKAIDSLAPRTEQEMNQVLETLGFRARWKAEAKEAIKALEKLTGQKFKSEATRDTWPKLPAKVVKEIQQCRESGYYMLEAIAARDEVKRLADIQEEVAEIEAAHKATVAKSDLERRAKLALARRGHPKRGNVIFYSHTKELHANWTSTEPLWTETEWQEFVASLAPDELPEGLKFTFAPKPKY